jgi:hypothetical protein
LKHSENEIDADFPLFEGKRLNPIATIEADGHDEGVPAGSRRCASGRPATNPCASSCARISTTRWKMADGKINGEYEMMSQGAIVYSKTYTNARTGKKIDFAWAQDVDASGKTGCRW